MESLVKYNTRHLGIHIELTSNCNSRCLDCDRFIEGTDMINPYVDIGTDAMISLEAIENIFTDEIASTAKYVNFTGTYGDAILHPEFHKICNFIADRVQVFKEKRMAAGLNSKLIFMMETNAGIRDSKWWRTLGEIIYTRFSPQSKVIVALDGIDNETHQKYRRGVDFDTVISNSLILIKKQIRVSWSFIEFAHNSEQLDLAKEMAKSLGFHEFKVRRSRLRTNVHHSHEIQNVFQKKKGINTEGLHASQRQRKLFADSVDKSTSISYHFHFEGPYRTEWTDTDIICEWKKNRSISVDYTGRVWQCCYFSTFYHSGMNIKHLDRYNNGLDVNKKVQEYENLTHYECRYEKDWNNVNYHGLHDILNHRFFTVDLPTSFTRTIDDPDNPMIYRCGKFCGNHTRKLDEELRKIGEQK